MFLLVYQKLSECCRIIFTVGTQTCNEFTSKVSWYLEAMLLTVYNSILCFNMLHILSKSSGLLLWEEDVGSAVEGVADEGFAGMCRLGVIGFPCSVANSVTAADVVTTLLLHVRVVVAICYPMWAVVCLLVALVTVCRCAQPSFPHVVHKFRSIKLSSTSHIALSEQNVQHTKPILTHTAADLIS